MSLFSRLSVSTAVLAITVIILAIVLFTFVSVGVVTHALQYTLRGYSQSLTEQILSSSDPLVWQEIAREHKINIIVETPDTKEAFDSLGNAMPPEAFSHSIRTIEVLGDPRGRVDLNWNLSHLRRGHDLVLVAYILLLLAIFGGAHWFQSSQLRPLRWLRAGVEAVSRGDFKTKVPVVRRDEIGQVAVAFNQMMGQVEAMLEDRERLLADVSHELRSPLTRMKVALELLPDNEKRDGIQRDIQEMETLIAVLLERERLRARAHRIVTQPEDLVNLVHRVVETFANRKPGLDVRPGLKELVAEVDRDLIRLLLQNLMDNALKFTPEDGPPVEVAIQRIENSVEISISDHGTGIAAENLDRLFEPFVKLDPARGHHRGYGLGLNLCWRIVEAHGGTISLIPNEVRGTKARVVLPVREP